MFVVILNNLHCKMQLVTRLNIFYVECLMIKK
jgi:hypothetical protein